MIITRSGTCLCRRSGAGRGERRCSRALERGRRRGWASGQGRGGAGCCRKRTRVPEVGRSRQCGSRSALVRGLLASCWDGKRCCTCSHRLHPASTFGAAPAPSRGAAVPPSWSAGWADVVGTGDGRAGLGGKGRGRGGGGVRAEEVGSGGDSAYLCFFFCGRPARTPCPLVGEARETTKEFDRETFWRRLRECLSCCRLPSLISCGVPTPFLPAFPCPILSVGIPRLTHPRHLWDWDRKHWFGVVFLRCLSRQGWRGNALSSKFMQPLEPYPFGTNILAPASSSITSQVRQLWQCQGQPRLWPKSFLDFHCRHHRWASLSYSSCDALLFLRNPLIFFPRFTFKAEDLIFSSVK